MDRTKQHPTPRRDDQRHAKTLRMLDDHAAHGDELSALKAKELRKRIARSTADRAAHQASRAAS